MYNNIQFLTSLIDELYSHNIVVVIFGWRAEELSKVIEPKPHKDIDLLYIAEDFSELEKAMKNNKEIEAKRLYHKRAYIINNIMVEFFLLQKQWKIYYTNFYGNKIYERPKDMIQTTKKYNDKEYKIASKETLQLYRTNYPNLHNKK